MSVSDSLVVFFCIHGSKDTERHKTISSPGCTRTLHKQHTHAEAFEFAWQKCALKGNQNVCACVTLRPKELFLYAGGQACHIQPGPTKLGCDTGSTKGRLGVHLQLKLLAKLFHSSGLLPWWLCTLSPKTGFLARSSFSLLSNQ